MIDQTQLKWLTAVTITCDDVRLDSSTVTIVTTQTNSNSAGGTSSNQ